MDWWTEILREEGWFAMEEPLIDENGKIAEGRVTASAKGTKPTPKIMKCPICGTTTGLHGFSFERR